MTMNCSIALLARRATVLTHSASFHSARLLQAVGSQQSNQDPEVLQKEKNKTLGGDKIEYNEKLASESEAHIKADKEHHDKSPEELQEHTAKEMKGSHGPDHTSAAEPRSEARGKAKRAD